MTHHRSGARGRDAWFRSLTRAAIVAFAATLSSIWAAPGCQASEAATARLPLLTTARQVNGLTPDQASRRYPARLRCVVTYWDPYQAGHRALFIVDQTGGVFIAPGTVTFPMIHAGSVIEVTGITDPGGYSPIVLDSTVRVVQQTHSLPEARPIGYPEMLNDSQICQWVAVRGIVHSVEFEGQHVMLTLATADGSFTATTDKEDGANYAALVDSEILIRGVDTPLNNSRRQMTGARLLYPGMASISIMKPAPPDPFLLPVQSLSSLLQYSPQPASPHRIHVRGRVTLSWPGQKVCIADQSAGLCVQTNDPTALREGDLVDAAGFLGRQNYLPSITAATLKLISQGNPVAAIPLSVADALKPANTGTGGNSKASHIDIKAANAFGADHNGELVSVEGRLLGKNRGLTGSTLLFSSGGVLFSVVPPAAETGNGEQLESSVVDGSTIRMTGIFVAKIDERRTAQQEGLARLESFQILLRSPGVVVVLSVPTWWNGRHALELLAFVVLTMVVILVWVGVLRRQVHRQTVVIRRSEERFRHIAEHDGLTGLPVRGVLLDRLGLALNKIRSQSDSLALLMVDVDKFKQINDSLGHAAGDAVLCTIGSRLQRSLRPTDIVARMGGDEFTVLLTGLRHLDEAKMIASQLVTTVSAPIEFDGHQLEISVSIGVATYPEGGVDVESLLRNSDAALYAAKTSGRNRFHLHSAA